MVFFCFSFFVQCKKNTAKQPFDIVYQNNKAVGIHFKSPVLSKDTPTVHLQDNTTAILGEYTRTANGAQFTPVLPFKENQRYTIRYEGNTFYFKTKADTVSAPAAKLVQVYPSADTIPENVLKMYFIFSKPMQEVGSALDFIKVKNIETGVYDDVFLSLETELWNSDHTELTLWLDPGRVKTDLIPNRERGLPLRVGMNYQLEVDSNWKDAQGNTLGNNYRKIFYVDKRDTEKPNIRNWKLKIPAAGSKGPLQIHFHESLDALLLLETIEILNETNKSVKGMFELGAKEVSMYFKPINNWKKANYKIKVNAKLEDLAANNLHALFDQDIKAVNDTMHRKEFYYKAFRVN